MKMYSLVILLVLSQVIQAQGNYGVLIIESDTSSIDSEVVEEYNSENERIAKIKYIQNRNGEENKDSSKISYKYNFVFQYGGESKFTILPKFNFFRVHNLNFIKPYYGLEAGLHPLMVAGAFTFSGVCGIEKGIFNLETSLSHFRTTRISDGDDGFNGPFSQNLFNLKLGIRIKKVYLKIGRSFLLNENIPAGQDRIPLLDIGKINGNIYGVELQFILD